MKDSLGAAVPSGKHTKNYGTSPFFMGKLTISMAIFSIANCECHYQSHQKTGGISVEKISDRERDNQIGGSVNLRMSARIAVAEKIYGAIKKKKTWQVIIEKNETSSRDMA